jgi:XTP/dITP diphosphohydrolase
MGEPAPGDRLLEFLEVMRRLRVECSWKAGQTHRSLARYLLEETHETLEAIDTGDQDHLREELGDLLLQVYFHAVIAEESGDFTIDDVAGDIIEKMHRRNPHVFAPAGGELAPGGDAESINEVWESIKAQEKQRDSVTDGLPPGLPALLYADKVLDRLERAGTSSGTSVGSSAEQVPAPSADVGDRLLAVVADARRAGVDPEQALRDAVRRLL